MNTLPVMAASKSQVVTMHTPTKGVLRRLTLDAASIKGVVQSSKGIIDHRGQIFCRQRRPPISNGASCPLSTAGSLADIDFLLHFITIVGLTAKGGIELLVNGHFFPKPPSEGIIKAGFSKGIISSGYPRGIPCSSRHTSFVAAGTGNRSQFGHGGFFIRKGS